MSLISFGAGVNSTAMTILLVNRGWRGPIVFADTGAEHPETYCYLDYFEREWLQPRGLEITRLRGLPWQNHDPQGKSLIEYCEAHAMIPLAAARFCTVEYKSEPIARYAQSLGETEQLIGIAADESSRQKGRLCPLIDAGIDRKGCIKIIEAEGLSVPPKSGCYICPFQKKSQWRDLYQRHPELYERAAKLEEKASARTGRFMTLDPSGKESLRQLEIAFRDQLSLFDDALMDSLLSYRPCLCGI